MGVGRDGGSGYARPRYRGHKVPSVPTGSRVDPRGKGRVIKRGAGRRLTRWLARSLVHPAATVPLGYGGGGLDGVESGPRAGGPCRVSTTRNPAGCWRWWRRWRRRTRTGCCWCRWRTSGGSRSPWTSTCSWLRTAPGCRRRRRRRSVYLRGSRTGVNGWQPGWGLVRGRRGKENKRVGKPRRMSER